MSWSIPSKEEAEEYTRAYLAAQEAYAEEHSDDCCEMIDEAPTVCGWISVNERLPQHYDRVPVLIKFKDEDASDELHCNYLWYVHEPFSNGEKPHWEKIGRREYEVRYWFELPEPPKP